MHSSSIIYAVGLALVSAASATPSPGTFVRRQTNGEPCAQIAQAASNAGTDTSAIQIPSQLAVQCLQSMPFHQQLAADFLSQTNRYLEFQSTIEALKNPPEGYPNAPVDLFAVRDQIAANISSNAYASQYDFDLALTYLYTLPQDGHLSLSGVCSSTIFDFTRNSSPLVSISPDGVQLPQIYLLSDARLLANDSSTPVSPIISVNGQSVDQYVESYTNIQNNQDPDARYNTAFPSYAQLASRNGGGLSPGSFSSPYLGLDVTTDLTLAFANGSSTTVGTTALAPTSFNSTDGASLFEAYCLPKPSSSSGSGGNSQALSKDDTSSNFTAPEGYPEPFVRDGFNEMLGFDLEGSDAVVMFVPTFEGDSDPRGYGAEIHRVAVDIIEKGLAAGKKRIIIDVSGNGGGEIDRGFDLFKIFFPHKFPYSATRFRNHPAATFFGRAAAGADFNKSAADNSYYVAYAFQGDVTPDQQHDFKSMADVFNGGIELGVPVSNLVANFNFSLRNDITIEGYQGVPETFSSPPFEPENILIIGNGYCASTCTTFTNLMTNVGGVRSLALGGRPNGQKMPVMGGVRGGQSASWGLLDNMALELSKFNETHPGFFTKEEQDQAAAVVPMGLPNLPLVLKSGSVNLRNAYQEGADHLPLQFVNQPADCRLYYTFENMRRPSSAWGSAYNAVWGNGTCVGGSSPSSSINPTSATSPTATASATLGTFTGGAVRNGLGWAAAVGLVALLNL